MVLSDPSVSSWGYCFDLFSEVSLGVEEGSRVGGQGCQWFVDFPFFQFVFQLGVFLYQLGVGDFICKLRVAGGDCSASCREFPLGFWGVGLEKRWSGRSQFPFFFMCFFPDPEEGVTGVRDLRHFGISQVLAGPVFRWFGVGALLELLALSRRG